MRRRFTNGWAALQRRIPFRAPRGIVLRISGFSWTIALFSLLIFLAGSIPQQKHEIEDSLQSKARGIAASLHEGLANAAVTEDYSALVDQCVQAVAADDAIDFLVIAKNDGFTLVVDKKGWRVDRWDAFWRPANRTPRSGIKVVPILRKRVFHYARPYNYSSIDWGWVNVGLSLDSYDRGVNRLYQRTGILAVLCVAGSLVASVLFAKRLVRPMVRLQTVVGRIAAGDLSARATIRGAQEIESLAQSFNGMADSLLQRDEILESVRFAAQRFLSANAWEAAIQEVLSKLGGAAHVCRVFLLENHAGQPDELRGKLLYEWLKPGAAAGIQISGRVESIWTAEQWRAWSGALSRGEPVLVEACPVRGGTVMARRSCILVPVEVGGHWFGVLGFDDCSRERTWSDAERDSFRSAAGMLGAAITRQQAQEYVDNILRSMGESLIVTDSAFRIRRVNPTALRLLGYAEEELIGQPVGLIIDGGLPAGGVGIERTYRTKPARPIPVLLSCAELRSGQGSLIGYVCLAQDVTELKRTRIELERARDDAQDANRAKSVFLANMSHELRTPLNAIIGYSQMLREDCLGPEQVELSADLEKIEHSGQLLLGIIEDILDLSKIEAGRDTVRAQDIDVARVLQDVSNTLQPLARQQGNVLEIDCPDQVRTAYADLAKFRQSVLNLVNNALKFTEKGRVSVIVNQVETAGGEWTDVHVCDTGIGIGPEHLGKLFQPFSQVDGSATRKYNGTGLGLAISRKFCQMMGGDITVESQPGRGSRFSIRVPATPVTAARAMAEPGAHGAVELRI